MVNLKVEGLQYSRFSRKCPVLRASKSADESLENATSICTLTAKMMRRLLLYEATRGLLYGSVTERFDRKPHGAKLLAEVMV